MLSDSAHGEVRERPNIVFILADDLGYGELGCYGQTKIQTPHIDALAAGGVRLTSHYSGAPVCAPARCTLLTGQHTGHAQIRGNRDSGNGQKFPGQWPITAEVITVAEVLKSAGYVVGGFGKWGLGPSDSTGSPIKQGFDRFFGYNCQRNAHSYYPPYLDDDESQVTINVDPIPGHLLKSEGIIDSDDYRAGVYAPDRILEEALSFLDQHRSEPFFIYLPFVEPHVAMQPPRRWVDHYPADWDREFGSYRGQNGYLPHPRPRAAYAAMISDLDEHVGSVMKRLDDLGLVDDTLVIFTSDNGPTHPSRDPNFHVGGAACEFFDSAAGLKGWKGSCYEGGLRVPCIVRFPGRIPGNTIDQQPSYFPDWMPTLAAVAGAVLPTQQVCDGVDLLPALESAAKIDREAPLIWSFAGYGGIAAVRQNEWKAVRSGLNTDDPGKWELYNIESDPRESEDLAVDHPEIVAELADGYAEQVTPSPVFKMLN